MICPHGHDEGMIPRAATPAEVDAGCELGEAYDPCPECHAECANPQVARDDDAESTVVTFACGLVVDFLPHSSRPFREQVDAWHYLGVAKGYRLVEVAGQSEALLGVPDYDGADRQALQGDVPPAHG